ncbi:flagellar basal-body rod modification protein FlgD [Mobilisporobacter senegalensis]|uniref:Basal-body rod modification protein FlgD n=1 Tax=Mobilisporobacter senegalensis TaxID=1329262 RepID=A0A3N1XWV3_9FIRM|nr:flagellar hook capping FlgD N-terminal domain-containing protein [Mobilisporobacter senegalensis]ROR30768.1 flagellar basal-body rod modification protein FlgD [Mobilisporobacter senegalensis]
MADLVNGVENGVLKDMNTTSKTSNYGNNTLGKDAFLKLLAAQMKYQDPLNPSTDTEYVAQLATFSQLEQMQNLNTTSTNTQAFGLVGKNVIMKTVDTGGNTSYVSGRVDFATMTNGAAYLSINGSLYPASNLDTVIDEAFLDSLGLPYVTKTDLSFDKATPIDQSFQVSLGSSKNAATKATIKIGEVTIEDKYVSISESGLLTIDKEALKDFEVGAYKVQIVFDDVSKTTVKDTVTLTVTDSTKTPSES